MDRIQLKRDNSNNNNKPELNENCMHWCDPIRINHKKSFWVVISLHCTTATAYTGSKRTTIILICVVVCIYRVNCPCFSHAIFHSLQFCEADEWFDEYTKNWYTKPLLTTTATMTMKRQQINEWEKEIQICFPLDCRMKL